MIESTLMIDSYGRNMTYENDTAIIHQIYHLVVMDKGTDELNPNKGVSIINYKYEFNDNSILVELEKEIKDQISKYTPYTIMDVICKGIKNNNGIHILHVFIMLNEVPKVINISTDGERSELALIDL